MADIVLVHGTTQSADGYAALGARLQERGHRPWALQVPKGGASTSREYAEALAAQLPPGVQHPVVVAHSAAGLLLPALARRLDALHQVWMAAAVADYAGGRSFLSEFQQDPHSVVSPEWVDVDPTTDPVLATYFLFHDADLSTLRAGLATLASCDLSAVYAEMPSVDPTRVPSTYLLPTGDRTLRPEWMARVARERLHVEPTPIRGGHSPFVASPNLVADQIVAGFST